jgi:hypothetical protein
VDDVISFDVLMHYLILQEFLGNIDLKLFVKITSKNGSRIKIFVGFKDIGQVLNEEEAVIDF